MPSASRMAAAYLCLVAFSTNEVDSAIIDGPEGEYALQLKAKLQRAKRESRPHARIVCQPLPCRAAVSHLQANGNLFPRSCTVGKCTILTLETTGH